MKLTHSPRSSALRGLPLTLLISTLSLMGLVGCESSEPNTCDEMAYLPPDAPSDGVPGKSAGECIGHDPLVLDPLQATTGGIVEESDDRKHSIFPNQALRIPFLRSSNPKFGVGTEYENLMLAPNSPTLSYDVSDFEKNDLKVSVEIINRNPAPGQLYGYLIADLGDRPDLVNFKGFELRVTSDFVLAEDQTPGEKTHLPGFRTTRFFDLIVKPTF